ncbi:hypothetical protein K440DRAFT_375476 [Wilcoxina mikolae CBS 423.85]|nr:hypothetical protein K440DRAFT_375476 [Wilcoxina mikolae CBS 423.85]
MSPQRNRLRRAPPPASSSSAPQPISLVPRHPTAIPTSHQPNRLRRLPPPPSALPQHRLPLPQYLNPISPPPRHGRLRRRAPQIFQPDTSISFPAPSAYEKQRRHNHIQRSIGSCTQQLQSLVSQSRDTVATNSRLIEHNALETLALAFELTAEIQKVDKELLALESSKPFWKRRKKVDANQIAVQKSQLVARLASRVAVIDVGFDRLCSSSSYALEESKRLAKAATEFQAGKVAPLDEERQRLEVGGRSLVRDLQALRVATGEHEKKMRGVVVSSMNEHTRITQARGRLQSLGYRADVRAELLAIAADVVDRNGGRPQSSLKRISGRSWFGISTALYRGK